MAFTYDPTTKPGRVRLLIADTDPDAHDFSDEEVDAALAVAKIGGVKNVKSASAFLLMSLASNRARLSISYRRGDTSEDLTQLANDLRAQAKQLQDEAESEGDGPLVAQVTPSYERFSSGQNIALDREDETREAP